MTDRKQDKQSPTAKKDASETEQSADAWQPSKRTQPAKPKSEGKSAKVMSLLRQTDGATLNELVAETGWLPHTTRAALTGLKKKGHDVTSEKVEGVRRYRLRLPQ